MDSIDGFSRFPFPQPSLAQRLVCEGDLLAVLHHLHVVQGTSALVGPRVLAQEYHLLCALGTGEAPVLPHPVRDGDELIRAEGTRVHTVTAALQLYAVGALVVLEAESPVLRQWSSGVGDETGPLAGIEEGGGVVFALNALGDTSYPVHELPLDDLEACGQPVLHLLLRLAGLLVEDVPVVAGGPLFEGALRLLARADSVYDRALLLFRHLLRRLGEGG